MGQDQPFYIVADYEVPKRLLHVNQEGLTRIGPQGIGPLCGKKTGRAHRPSDRELVDLPVCGLCEHVLARLEAEAPA